MKRLSLLLALSLSAPHLAVPQERWQARSMVISNQGIAATSQTLASQAAAQILARGGSAVDAAIAANAVLSVVEPMMCGIGGDLFAIHWDAKTNKLTGINASGPTPKGMTINALKAKGHYNMPGSGIHTVSVPGAVDGWAKMHQKFGRLPWVDLFQPAIHHARNGFPVTEIIQYDWSHTVSKLDSDSNARKVYLIDGRAPAVGEIFRNPQLANAFEALAQTGRDAFYKGPIAQSILKTSKRLGGTLTADDLAGFHSEWINPIATTYRGWKVSEMPPNGQGIAVLMMLNIMEKFPIHEKQPLSADAFHWKIEAQKLAYQDLRAYNADSRAVTVPTKAMLSKDYATERAKQIELGKAGCSFSPGEFEKGSHTIYLSVVDKEGNIVSWIQSISDLWGSGVVVDDFGFQLHDRAGGFTFDPQHPNVLAPGKRPYHTIIPGFMEKGDQKIGFGIMRGANQALAHAQFVSNIVDHGMNIQAALEAPRFTRQTLGGCDVLIESRVPAAEREDLTKRGHYLDVRGEYSGQMGGGQAVLTDTTRKVHYGASSPRKDGAAIPEPIEFWKATARPAVKGQPAPAESRRN